jgi:hypothetical protein
MHNPHEPHLIAVKLILRYLHGTLGHNLLLCCGSMLDLVVYTDADLSDYLDTHRSTSGYTMFLSVNLVS